ncbi:unnamed protein product [Spodoptera exigua]|nr:unnamed protein product [Spodoptera exigua]
MDPRKLNAKGKCLSRGCGVRAIRDRDIGPEQEKERCLKSLCELASPLVHLPEVRDLVGWEQLDMNCKDDDDDNNDDVDNDDDDDDDDDDEL